MVNNYTNTGAVRRRQPNHSGDLNRIRQTSDGHILPNPGIGAALNWNVVVDFLEAPELDDEKFSTPSARLANAEELGEILDRIFLTKNKFEMFFAAHQKRFIYGVVQSPEEVLADEQFKHRGYFVEIDHPVVGPITYPGAPFLMEDTPWEVRRPAPTLGQHNGDVFGDRLGCAGEDLARLRALEVI